MDKDDISKWGFRRKCLHDGGEGTYGMPPKEIYLWIKASL
jgi:hypothetical protein